MFRSYPVALLSLVDQFGLYFKGVIPKPRVLTSGARDLACSATGIGMFIGHRQSEGYGYKRCEYDTREIPHSAEVRRVSG